MFFIGRDDERARWRSLLAVAGLERTEGQGDASSVVVIHGIGGLGKSELTRALLSDTQEASTRAEAGAILIDLEAERQRSPARFPAVEGASLTTVLYTVERALAEEFGADAEVAFAGFRSVLGEVLQIAVRGRAPVAEKPVLTPDELRGVEEAVAISAGLAGLHVASPELSAGIAVGSASVRAVRRFRSGRRAREEARTPFAPVAQVQLDIALEPERVLVEKFSAATRDLTKERTVVIAIDTAELMVHALPRLSEMTRRTGGRLVWLIAGRLSTPADAGHSSTIGVMQRTVANRLLTEFPLPYFDRDLQRAYASERLAIELSDEELTRLDEATHGIPLALSLAIDILRDGVPISEALAPIDSRGDANAVVRGMAERFLYHAMHASSSGTGDRAEDIDDIFALAVDETTEAGTVIGFDLQRRIIAALMGVSPAELSGRIEALAARHEFVFRGSGRLHNEVAGVLRRFLLDATQRLRTSEMHRRVVALLESELRDGYAGRSASERVADDAWKVLAVALVGHKFWISATDGLSTLRSSLPGIAAADGSFGRTFVAASSRFWAAASASEREHLESLAALTVVANPPLSESQSAVGLAREALSFLDVPDPDPLLDLPLALRDQALILLRADYTLAEGRPEVAASQITKLSEASRVAFAPAVRQRAHAIARALTAADLEDDLVRMRGLRDAMTVATDVWPDDADAWATLSFAHGMLGDETAGLVAAEEALRLRPRSTSYLERKAWRLNGLGDVSAAREAIAAALTLRPEDAHLYACEAELCVRAADYTSAIIAAERSLELAKSDEATDMLTLAHAALRTPLADPLIFDALRSTPDSLQSWVLAAVANLNLGDRDAASQLFSRALTAPGKHVPPRDKAELRAFALAALGRLDEGVSRFDEWFAPGTAAVPLYYPTLYSLIDHDSLQELHSLQGHIHKVLALARTG